MGNTTSRLAEDTVIEDVIDVDPTVDVDSSVDDGMSVDDTELWLDELPNAEGGSAELLRHDLDSEGNKLPFGDDGKPYDKNLVEYDKDVLEYTEENNHIIKVFEKQFETIAKEGSNVLSGWLWIAAHFGMCKDAKTWDPNNLTPERERELVEEYGENLLRAADIDVEEVGRVTRTLGKNPIDVSDIDAESPRWQHLLRHYSREGFDFEDLVMEFRRFLGQYPGDTEKATDKLEEMFDNLSAETRLLVIAPELQKFYAEGDTPSTPLTPSTQLRSPYGSRPSGRSLLKALSPTKVRIDGLPEDLRLEEYLEGLAASFGPIISVTWIYDEDDQETGSAYMVFEHSSHAIEFQAKYDGLVFDEEHDELGSSLPATAPISVQLVTDDDEVNAIDDETNNEKYSQSLEQPIVIDSDTSSTTSSLPPTVSRIPSMPSTPRSIDIAHQSPGPRSPTFSDTFDTLTGTATTRKPKKPASRYRDPRLPRVDPLRYQNRLEEPRRLPKTPTASHWPPAPYSHRGKTPAPRSCMTCGRAFRKAKTAAGKKATAGKRTVGGRVKKTVTVVPAKKYELRSSK